mgnify:CR=1 FL=1
MQVDNILGQEVAIWIHIQLSIQLILALMDLDELEIFYGFKWITI